MKCTGTGTVSRVTENGGMKITGNINLRYIMENIDYNAIAGERVTLSYKKDGEIIANTFAAASPTVVNLDLSDCIISWIKLELGNTATPFVPRPIAEELASCLRYYCRMGDSSDYMFGWAIAYNATSVYPIVYFPVGMRTQPKFLLSNASHFMYRDIASLSITELIVSVPSSDRFMSFRATVSGATAARVGMIRPSAVGAAAWMAFDAEL